MSNNLFTDKKLCSCHMLFNALNNWYGAGLERTKAKVISGKPYAKLTHIQNVNKNTRENTKIVKIKPEKDMAKQQNRGDGRVN